MVYIIAYFTAETKKSIIKYYPAKKITERDMKIEGKCQKENLNLAEDNVSLPILMFISVVGQLSK